MTTSKDIEAPGVRTPASNEQRALACFRQLVKTVELTEVRLVSVKATLNANQLAENRECDFNIADPLFRAAFDAERRVLYCGVRFKIGAGPGNVENDEDDEVALFIVSAEYDLFYSVPPSVEVIDEATSVFAARNAAFNAWPFFRELTYSLVGRMALPPLVVPLLRMPLDVPRPWHKPRPETDEEASDADTPE